MDAEIERRVQEEINARMNLELVKQKEAIESEIQRRVSEARKQIEKELGEEMDKQKQAEYKRQLEREVMPIYLTSNLFLENTLLIQIKLDKMLLSRFKLLLFKHYNHKNI